MGQYYYAINVLTKQYLTNHDYGGGIKLMEHSYVGNKLMQAVEGLLREGEDWYKCQLVWGGDYADNEPGLLVNGEPASLHLYVCEGTELRIKSEPTSLKSCNYLLNHDSKQYVDMTKLPVIAGTEKKTIHPLPLLTCEGNGRGGGDYRGDDMDKVGIWSRAHISVQDTPPA